MNRVMTVVAPCMVAIALALSAAEAASLSKTQRFYSIGGSTLEEIEAELNKRGPRLSSSNTRHPGATQIEFKTRVTYGESKNRCGVLDATVAVSAEMILPRWKRTKRADADTRLIWDVLASDIKRHEEAHVTIARNHARELEDTLKTLGRKRDCERAQRAVKEVTARILEKHDREQGRFDRVESINFEDRLQRLIRYRLERLESSR